MVTAAEGKWCQIITTARLRNSNRKSYF